MPNVISQSQLNRYLKELAKDECALNEAADEFESAKARVEMGVRRFLALRDFVAEQLGENPYASSVMDRWPDDAEASTRDEDGYPIRGRFRYTGMKVGDAVIAVLREERSRPWGTNGWMTLAEVIKELSRGGFGFPDSVQARAVNAALRNTTGVITATRANDQVRVYRVDPNDDSDAPDVADPGYEDASIDPDDLPFE